MKTQLRRPTVFNVLQVPLPSTVMAESKAWNTPVKTLNKTESKIDIHAPASPQFALTTRSKEGVGEAVEGVLWE